MPNIKVCTSIIIRVPKRRWERSKNVTLGKRDGTHCTLSKVGLARLKMLGERFLENRGC